MNYHPANVNSYSDYYPFGMLMPNRHGSDVSPVDDYKRGFNGMEKDGEIHGESYTTSFRQLDTRIGRWLSLDPLMAKYPHQSGYAGFNNNPIYFADPTGLEGDPPGGVEVKSKNNNVGDDIAGLPPSAENDQVFTYTYSGTKDKITSRTYQYSTEKEGWVYTSMTYDGIELDMNGETVFQGKGDDISTYFTNYSVLADIVEVATAINEVTSNPTAANSISTTIYVGGDFLASKLNVNPRTTFGVVRRTTDAANKLAYAMNDGLRFTAPVKFGGINWNKHYLDGVRKTSNVLKGAGPALAIITTSAEIIANSHITASHVMSATVTGIAMAVSAPAALVVGGVYTALELGSWLFTGKSLGEHLNGATDAAGLSQKKGGVLYDWDWW